MHEDLIEEIIIPEKAEVELNNDEIIAKGPKGEVKRKFAGVNLKKTGNKLVMDFKKATKNNKRMIKTSSAHIKNMLKGVTEGYEYKLQICSVHFPLTVKADKEFVTIKNFLGETKERKAKIVGSAHVKIEGDIVTVTSADKEAAGQTSTNIENATRVKNRDRRVFQDGIWLTVRAGEAI